MPGAQDWNDLKVVLAVARTGGLRAAGRNLGIDGTTVWRRLRALEARLGVALFATDGRTWRPTAAGARVAVLAESVEVAARQVEQVAAAEALAPEGVVRLSVPELLGAEVVMPLLGELRNSHPRLRFEVHASNEAALIHRREADLAVRLNRPAQAGLVARRLGEVRTVLVASRAYLATRGQPTTATLAQHDLVWDSPRKDTSVEGRWLARHAPGARPVLRTDNAHARRAALRAGLGVGFLPRVVCERELELVALPGLPPLPARGLWLVLHPEARREASVSAVARALAAGLEARVVERPLSASVSAS